MRNTESGRSKRTRVAIFVLLIAVSFGLFMASRNPATPNVLPDQSGTEQDVNRGEGNVTDELPDQHGRYTTPEDVASYLHAYGAAVTIYEETGAALGWNRQRRKSVDVTATFPRKASVAIGKACFGSDASSTMMRCQLRRRLPRPNDSMYQTRLVSIRNHYALMSPL